MDQNAALNITNPARYWIDDRCYRVLNSPSNSGINYAEEDSSYQGQNSYQDEPECEMNSDIDVEYVAANQFRSIIAMASSFFPHIIGVRGANKKRIENLTHTSIAIPYKGQEGDVVVKGRCESDIRKAVIHIETIVKNTKKKLPCTHFIAIPFNTDIVQQTFTEFKRQVLEKHGSCRGIEDTIFVDSKKLHLTLCVMVLVDDKDRKEAVRAFEDCHQEIMNEGILTEPLKVLIEGIGYMNDDPGNVNVLYANVSSVSWNQSLQHFVDTIYEKMVIKGIARKERESVKLHVTLMNTKLRDGDNDLDNRKKRVSFDASEILKDFKDFRFGEITATELHLSLCHSVSKDGFYSSSRILPLKVS